MSWSYSSKNSSSSLFDIECLFDTAANPVLNRHACQLDAVDEHNPHGHVFGRPTRRFGERGGRHKQALGRFELIERPEEIAICSGTYDAFSIPFCLNINAVKPERVLINDAINAPVTTLSECAGGIRRGAAIAHRCQELDDQPLEEYGARCLDTVEQFTGQC